MGSINQIVLNGTTINPLSYLLTRKYLLTVYVFYYFFRYGLELIKIITRKSLKTLDTLRTTLCLKGVTYLVIFQVNDIVLRTRLTHM